jgi:hypothetical protein
VSTMRRDGYLWRIRDHEGGSGRNPEISLNHRVRTEFMLQYLWLQRSAGRQVTVRSRSVNNRNWL